MNKIRFISLTASLVLAITFTLSCEDKETKDKPAAAVAVPETAGAASPPETVAGSGGGGKIMYVNDVKGLNMRSEPSTDGAKLGTLSYGTKIQVLEKSSTPVKIGDITDYWYKIEANVTLGGKVYKHSWVFGGFLSENLPKGYAGIYEYKYPYASEPSENQYIVLSEKNGKTSGFYYGTSDEFDSAREGYECGFFVVPMNQLKIDNGTIKFVLNVKNDDMLTKPVDLKITSTQEAKKAGYESWAYFGRQMRYTDPKKYSGFISSEEKTILFKKESDWEGELNEFGGRKSDWTEDRLFVKKN